MGATTVHRSISAVTRCHRQPIKKQHMINRHGSNLKNKNRHTLPNLNHTSREMTGWEGGRDLDLDLGGRTLLAYLSVCLTPCRSRAATGGHEGCRTQGCPE